MMNTVYSINPEVEKSISKRQTLIESYIPAEGLVKGFLRWMSTGPKTEEQIYSRFEGRYKSNQISRMVNYALTQNLIFELRSRPI